jgi:ornithine cyclodeaminase/alanine dehydrogenase-like protein (mu-crystallin family)
MALIGCGVQGRYHAVAMKSILPQISTIKIHDPWEPAVTSFLRDIGPRLPGVRLEEAVTPEAAIRDADLVVTATGRLLQPIFKCEWIKEGALLLPVHTMGWDSATASSMDKLFTDDWQQFLTVGKTAYQPLPDRPHAEIGEVVAGIKPGRESASERIVCFNKGLAIHDVLMGNTIYQKALVQGIGRRLEIQKIDQQLPMLEIE